MMNVPLPSETRNYLGNDKNKLLKSGNLGLIFNKFVYSWQSNWQMEEKNSKEFRNDIARTVSFDNRYIESLKFRQHAMINNLKSSGWHVEFFNATTDSRLIIGLGSESVIETGMTLHPLYGFPYLPASGLKGLARAYAEIGADASKEVLLEIFGSEDKTQHSPDNRQGKVTFMDGLPVSFPKLELDIMNPHYGDYYQGKKDRNGKPVPPADYLNPVPVTFLAVASGQVFSFALFSRDQELTQKAKDWLIGGLTELGAGGKTNVGYGYFHIEASVHEKHRQSEKPVKHEDNSLSGRLKQIRDSLSPEKFAMFVKSIKPEEMDSVKEISFKGMSINIGFVPSLESIEVSSDVLMAIAEKMLEVIHPKKKWNEAKREKYKKLLSMAGKEIKE